MKKLIVVFIGFLALILSACNSIKIDKCSPIYAMDTIINVTFYNVDDYKRHYNEIKKLYHSVSDMANDFESNSTSNSVYDLNTLRSIEANDLLIDLLNKAILMKEDTLGYYNPFIGRLARLWKDAIKNKEVLSDDLISSEIEIMNNTSLSIEGNKVSIIGEGNIDLGGIAKGYATELVKKYLDDNNIKGYLINAGSSNVLFGSKVDDNFRIALEYPYKSGYFTIVEDQFNAIGTSSPKHQYFKLDGVKYHHLLSPFTGRPVNNYDSVNILYNDSMLCDVYSTALFLMDENAAKEFALDKNIDIILFKDNSIIYKTDGWNLSE